MVWNWEMPDWPHFKFEAGSVAEEEKLFLLGAGSAHAFLKTIDKADYHRLVVEIMSIEGEQSSRIEGEILDRESLQSSIRRHFHLKNDGKKASDKEAGMAEMLCDVYENYDRPLTHEMLYKWHAMLFEKGGGYRTHEEPMQIVSHRYDEPKVFFEAPPSVRVEREMTRFIEWFNSASMGVLEKASIAHVYFESIHPFEDGNGRIGRILVEKVLSQGVGRPVLIAVSKRLEGQRKAYYSALESCNTSLEAGSWVKFFSNVILEAQKEAMKFLYFLIEKSKLLRRLEGQINERQLKALLKMFAAGPEGFIGGLSAEKYIAITKTTRSTATRDLTDLVEMGALVKSGELRHTRYGLNL